MRRLEAFLHAENHRSGCAFFKSHGFSDGPADTHLRRSRALAGWQPPTRSDANCSPLRPAHEIAFARLHAETFPAGGSTPADDLLAGRDDEHVIFAATDGLRLLGYVCVSVNHAPREGFIDYLAVKPVARGRGIGARLLQTALALDVRGTPAAAGGALRERMARWRTATLRASGFRLVPQREWRRRPAAAAQRRPRFLHADPCQTQPEKSRHRFRLLPHFLADVARQPSPERKHPDRQFARADPVIPPRSRPPGRVRALLPRCAPPDATRGRNTTARRSNP